MRVINLRHDSERVNQGVQLLGGVPKLRQIRE